MPTTASYGSWKSPITAEMVGAAGIGIGQVRYMDGDLYWLELRPKEGGRLVVVRRDPNGTISDITPEGFNARTTVHEYGGGSYFVNEGVVYFSNFDDQRLYGQEPGDQPHGVSPEPTIKWGLRYADGRAHPTGRWIAAVQEQHTEGEEATNSVVLLSPDGSAAPQVIVSGANFYSNPRFSPDGTRIAWLQWDHPNMPWDGTEVWTAEFATEGSVSNARKVAGGPRESIYQPEWSPDGVLHFISDKTDWWNLYKEENGKVVPLAAMDAEFGVPQWVFGNPRYAFLNDGRIACIWTKDGHDHLGILKPTYHTPEEIKTDFLDFYQIATDGEDRLWFIGGSASAPSALAEMKISSGQVTIIRRTMDIEIDPGYISVPQNTKFLTTEGQTAYALVYMPHNKDFSAPVGEKPPLLVISHGGPTSAATADFSLSIQYWTSRGFAVADVNYGGSTGYGRPYRERLNGQWGVVDVADCVNAAKHLAAQDRIDGERVAIRGGSAGGYTTLAALTFTNYFRAGASYFGIGDLETMIRDTHKFESRYCDTLVDNKYPASKEIVHERSPINFTENISAPMILFQGLEDKIVPPNQAEDMVRALRAKGLPYAYLPFEGEQHGFRKAETNKRCNEAELYFYSRIFGFELADEIEPVAIENL